MLLRYPSQSPGLFKSSSLLGFEFNTKMPGVNSLGMFDKEYSLQKPAGAYRILVLGDSITELGRWTDYIEDLFVKTLPGAPIEVMNAAVRAWDLSQYHAYFLHKGRTMNPNLVIMALCLDDLVEGASYAAKMCDEKDGTFFYFCVYPDGSANTPATVAINPALFRHSYIYRAYFTLRFYVLSRKGLSYSEKYTLAINKINEIKAALGPQQRIIAVVFPFLKPLKSYNNSELEMYRSTLAVLKETGIDSLDLTSYFNNALLPPEQYRAEADDERHFNDSAHHILAGLIEQWLHPRLQEHIAMSVSHEKQQAAAR